MPDTINKQTLINLLIDSPLREPIKINLIDIINNTSEPDLPKVYPTIVKELEIFQKATERRMKLADETIAKLSGSSQPENPVTQPMPESPLPPTMDSAPPTPSQSDMSTPSLPPLDLPPLPTPQPPSPVAATSPIPTVAEPVAPAPTQAATPLSVPPLDLPPMPAVSAPAEPVAESPAPAAPSSLPSPEPLGGPVATQSSDEAALAEIQKELESLKAGVAADANPAPAPIPTI